MNGPKAISGVESALLPTADIRQYGPNVPFVPILLQKSVAGFGEQ